MKSKFVSTGLVTILIIVLVTACASSTGTPPETSATLPAVIDSSGVVAEGRVEPVRYAEIAFTASGVVSEILVEEGQLVKQGQTLIRLGDETDPTYTAAQLELAGARQALNDLQNTAGIDLAQAVINLKDAKEEYDKADDYLRYLQNSRKVPQSETRLFLETKRNSWMYVYKTKTFRGPAPADWIIEAENDVALKKAEFDAAQHTYERTKDGVDTDQLAVLEARLDAAKAALAALSVTAPFDGIVAGLDAKAGGSINAGESAVTIADFSSWLVKTTDLTEIDVVKLAEGQPVTVTLDALPEVELKGKILSIGQNYSENQGDIVYEVTVLLTDTEPVMRWGMTAAVKFEH
jgi:multidrug resistance efflux pump